MQFNHEAFTWGSFSEIEQFLLKKKTFLHSPYHTLLSYYDYIEKKILSVQHYFFITQYRSKCVLLNSLFNQSVAQTWNEIEIYIGFNYQLPNSIFVLITLTLKTIATWIYNRFVPNCAKNSHFVTTISIKNLTMLSVCHFNTFELHINLTLLNYNLFHNWITTSDRFLSLRVRIEKRCFLT